MHGTQNSLVTFMYKKMNTFIPSCTVYTGNFHRFATFQRLKGIEITILRNLHHIIDKGRGCDNYWHMTTSNFHYCYYLVVLSVKTPTAK